MARERGGTDPRTERSPWRWLIPIPVQLVLGALTFIAGTRLDLWLFSGGEGQGHGIPFFSVIFLIIPAAVTVIVVIVCIIGLIVSLIRSAKRRREPPQPTYPPQPVSQQAPPQWQQTYEQQHQTYQQMQQSYQQPPPQQWQSPADDRTRE